jgi:hypothetical protein
MRDSTAPIERAIAILEFKGAGFNLITMLADNFRRTENRAD